MNKVDLEKLSPETLDQLNDALHEVLCESIITLLEDSIKNPGITKDDENQFIIRKQSLKKYHEGVLI